MKRALSRKNIWETLPRALKITAGRAARLIPLPYLLGKPFRQTLRFVRESQHWPIEWIREYQVQQLRRICALAYDNAPFYRRWFDAADFHPQDLRQPEDIQALPLIDRDTLLEHLGQMLTRPADSPGVDYISTGGTSGVPLQFYIGSNRSATEYAYLMASWQRAGYQLGVPMAIFRGRTVRPDRTGLYHDYDPILHHHYYSNFHMTDQNMQRYLEHIRTIGPCFLHVYPSSIATLARFLRRAGVQPPDNIRGIIAESEIVYPEQRKMVEEVFGCRLFSCYGHTEKLVLAVECEHSRDEHVWPTYGYFELVDAQGRPVRTPGARGEIVGTGFINTVVPFIRYRTGDYAIYVAGRCTACGRNHPVIREVRGHRIQEFLVTADGTRISWTTMNMHDDTFSQVRQFQFYQDTPGQALLRIVPASGFGEQDRARILRNLNNKLDHGLQVSIDITDSIPLTARGKGIYVDQRIPA